MRKDLCCCLTILVVLANINILCGTPCDEAKDWLREVGKEGLKNISDVWNQLKPWVSGNEANCLKALLNDTKDDDESNLKLSDVLRQYVFKEVTNSAPKQPGKKKKGTLRRPSGNRSVHRNKKRNNKNVERDQKTPQNKTMTATKI